MSNRITVIFTAVFLAALTAPAHAADWPACEKAKLRLLALEQKQRGASPGARKTRSGKSSRSPQSAAALDEWLWKNCRDYSYELRALEQSRM